MSKISKGDAKESVENPTVDQAASA